MLKKKITVLAFLVVSVSFSLTAGAIPLLSHEEVMELSTRGEQYLQNWQNGEAELVARELLEKAGDNKQALFFAGRVKFFQGDYRESLKLLEVAKTGTKLEQSAQDFYDLVSRTYQASEGFIKKESKHFIFRYQPGKDEVLTDYALEGLERAYQELGRDFNYFPEEKIIVEVYPDVESLAAVSTLTREEIETSGTIALCKFNRLIITSPRSLLRGYRWRTTLSHEYVHYLIMKRSNNTVPIWLHEGVAKYEEDRWRRPNWAGLAPASESLLAEALRSDQLITFEQMHPSFAKLKGVKQTRLAFAEVVTVVEYLLSQGSFPVLDRIFEQMKLGKSDDEAINSVLGSSLSQLQEGWKGFLRKKNLKEITGLQEQALKLKDPEAPVEEKEELEEIESERARKFTRLGDLLRNRNRLPAAVIEYQKADESLPNSPIIMNKLALTYLLDQQYAKASDVLLKALKLHPNFVTTYVHLGELYLSQHDYENAIKYYSEANEFNPFNPTIHQNLAFLYQNQGREKEAQREREIFKILTD
ncbi:MAG: tetratricopeptide repeat protein [Deltaproteobacteria bacterium]|nr:MAG: tetratricopeptide repeat protein [Deltaproteobacteria bacterium]